MCISVIALVSETILFPDSSLLEKKFGWAVMWRQFVSFKSFVKPQTEVISSSGIDDLDCLSFKSYH